jgi:hypothetical protein
MSEKKSVTREIKGECRRAGRKDKTIMLDQFIKLTGYNRKHAVRLLSEKADIQAAVTADGKITPSCGTSPFSARLIMRQCGVYLG